MLLVDISCISVYSQSNSDNKKMWCLRYFSWWRVSLRLSTCSIKTFQNKRKKNCCNFSVSMFSHWEWRLYCCYQQNSCWFSVVFFSPDLQKRLTSTTIGESEVSHAKMKVLTQRSGAKRWPWCYLLLSVLLKSRLCCLICTEPSITFMPLVVNKAILNLSRVMQSQTLSARLSCVDVGHWSVCVWEKVNKTLGHRLSSLWEFFLLTCCSE